MLKFLLFPFAMLYGAAVFLRNKFYDWRVLKSFEFDLPVICIGNLSAGGTGKTPHTEYIIDLLDDFFPVGVVSRGYGRQTHGYILADGTATALSIGDEPMQIKTNFPEVALAVGEDRSFAIPQLLNDVPGTKAIVLDDAFQHRAVKAGLNILLTDFNRPYYSDWLLPVGRLREFAEGSKRADIIIVTKTPEGLSGSQKESIIQKLKPLQNQKVFFSKLGYGQLFDISDTKKTISLQKDVSVLLVCGIANKTPLENYLKSKTSSVATLNFGDHHIYDGSDLGKMKNAFEKMNAHSKIIITTQKDAVKLASFKNFFEENRLPLYVQPVRPEFDDTGREQFHKVLFDYVSKYYSEVETAANN